MEDQCQVFEDREKSQEVRMQLTTINLADDALGPYLELCPSM